MKHIDVESYLQAATASEEAWDDATNKLLEFEYKIKELTVIKAQLKALLDNVSMSSTHLRSLLMDLEKFYFCVCGKLEDHSIHSSIDPMLKEAHPYTNAYEFRSENE